MGHQRRQRGTPPVRASLSFSLGTYFGKFTKSKKFRLNITCLDILAKYAKHKVWLKPSGEQSFLYGNHIIKSNA